MLLTPSADIALTKTDSADPVDPGGSYSYDLVVTNNGPDDATNVLVSDSVPTGLTVDGTSTASGTCSASGNDVSCDLGSLANGATWTIAVHVKVEPTHPAGSVSDPATVSATENDPNNANNAATQDTTIDVPASGTADLQIEKTVKSATADRGGDATYEITVTNNGPDDATNVVATDSLPSGLAFVSADPSQGTFDQSSGDWTIGDLANGDTVSMTLVAKVVDESDSVTNTATIKGLDQTDPTPANDSSHVVVDVLGTGGGKHHHGGGNGGGNHDGTGSDPKPGSQTDVSGKSGSLAFTGRDVAATALLGLVLLGIGALLLLLGRRRREAAGGSNAVGF